MKKYTILLATLLLLSGCGAKQETLTKYSADTLSAGFDTFITLVGYTKDQASFDVYFEQLKEEFTYYNALFDKYNTYEDYNSIKAINDNAGKQAVEVEPAVIEMIELAQEYNEITNGQFDITFGPVLEIWHQYRDAGTIANENGETPKLPSITILEEAAACTGFDLIEVDKEASTVYLTKECASLDVGAIAKGFATEKVAQSLEAAGLTTGIINAGGNVRLIGEKPDASAWTIGVQIPDPTTGGSLGNLKFNESYSMVTSGDYQRYFEYEGKKMHHIIDPSTLYPSTYSRSVTVVTPDSGIADALSTTLYTMSYEDGLALIETLRTQYNLEVGAVWVFDETTPVPDGVTTLKTGVYEIITTGELTFETYE